MEGEWNKPLVILASLAAVIAGTGFWFAIAQKLADPQSHSFSAALVILILYGAALALVFLFTSTRSCAWITAASIVPAPLFGKSILVVGAVAVVSFLFLLLFHRHIRFMKEMLARFTLWRVVIPAFPYFFTAVALLVGALYYVSPPNRSIAEDLTITRRTYNYLIAPAARFIDATLPRFSLEQTIDEFLAKQIEGTIDIPPELSGAKEEAIAAQRRQLSESFQIPLIGNETLADIGFTLLNKYIEELEQYKGAVAILLAFGVFLMVKALGLVLKWVMLLVLVLVYRALKAAGAIEIVEIQTPKEVLRVP